MILLRSAVFNVAFYFWTLANMLAALPFVAFMRRETLIRWMAFWARGVFALLARLCRIRVEVRGRANLPAGACVVAAKHQSAWDTLAYHVVLQDPAMVMKSELMSLPLYGTYSRKAGMIPIDRKGGGGALRKMLHAARLAKALGRQIVIFPQGTRVAADATGEAAPYLPGVAALYRDLGLPVVPVAVNSGVFWPRRRFLRKPGTIVLEFLEPLPPGRDRESFLAELKARIELASVRLLKEAGG
jgi:1-acyl-sn-glycerol-3-phosphate acyltransferase